MKIFFYMFYSILVISTLFTLGMSHFFTNKIGGNFTKNKKLSKDAQKLIQDCYKGLDKNKIIDCHIHILGKEKNKTGCYINKNMNSFIIHPINNYKYKIFLSASGITKKDPDTAYIKRLNKLVHNCNPYGKNYILAMDKYYDKNGTAHESQTNFYIPNEYVYALSKKYGNYIPVISINPYRKDAIQELKKWAEKDSKIKCIKWLPNSMGIDPSDTFLIPFYKTMIKYNIALLSHAGKEEAVDSEKNQKSGNPLLLRLPLNLGVKVIIAHCATSGKNIDLDNPQKNKVENFNLFLRMMNNKKYDGLLFADISGVTQFNRTNTYLKTLLNRTDLHHRLINGSDYPVPAVNFLIQTSQLRRKKFITEKERKLLNEIYKVNPLIFDFVLKRTIKSPDKKNKFSDITFLEK